MATSPNVVRLVRAFSGLSQERLADFVGVDQQTVSHWERGERMDLLTDDVIEDIAEIVRKTTDQSDLREALSFIR